MDQVPAPLSSNSPSPREVPEVEVFGLAVSAAQRMYYLRRYLDPESRPIQHPTVEPGRDEKVGPE